MFSIETEVFYVPSLSFILLPFWFFLDDFRRKTLSAGRPVPAGTEYPAAWANFSSSNILFPCTSLFRTNKKWESETEIHKKQLQEQQIRGWTWVHFYLSLKTCQWKAAMESGREGQAPWVRDQTRCEHQNSFQVTPWVELTSLIAFLNTANCKVIFLW